MLHEPAVFIDTNATGLAPRRSSIGPFPAKQSLCNCLLCFFGACSKRDVTLRLHLVRLRIIERGRRRRTYVELFCILRNTKERVRWIPVVRFVSLSDQLSCYGRLDAVLRRGYCSPGTLCLLWLGGVSEKIIPF